MDRITLQKVDESNFIACFNLELNDGQEQFVSHPIRSLAQAYVYYQQCTPPSPFSAAARWWAMSWSSMTMTRRPTTSGT